MSKTNITKALVALVFIAAVFAVGLFIGRTGGPGGFTVTTQYAMGAMDEAEIYALTQQVEARAERQAIRDTQATEQPAPEPVDDRVNINTANQTELQVLPGVGPAIAQRIIDHREANGPFRIIEEITDVSGIGPARFADIRDLIVVD